MAEIRAAGPEDVEAVHAVLADAHRGIYDEPELSPAMPANLLASGGGHVAESEGRIVGAGLLDRDLCRLWVLRAERRHGLGTRLLRELERSAEPGLLRFSAVTLEPAAPPFLRANGYGLAWRIWLLGIDLEHEPAAPEWPGGVAVRTFREADAPAVKRLLDEAYGPPGPAYAPLPYDDWRVLMLGDPSYDPSAWFLAVDGDEIVGAALNWREGYVKDLVVSPRRRRLGLGRALLLQTFREFRGRGIRRVTLKTDSTNPSQAVRFYEHVGMRIARTYEVFEKRI